MRVTGNPGSLPNEISLKGIKGRFSEIHVKKKGCIGSSYGFFKGKYGYLRIYMDIYRYILIKATACRKK